MRRVVFISAVMISVLQFVLAKAQTVETDRSRLSVLKAEARTVVVNVVVTGKDGLPVRGLRREDFEAAEDGRPQTITQFEEHTGTAPAATARLPELPANVFTNVPRVAPGDAVTVLLLDSLNTPLEDQARVHKEMVKYLEELPAGRRLGIFSLGSQLRYVQRVTDDPALLRQALANLSRGAWPRPSTMLKSKLETTAEQQVLHANGIGMAGLASLIREQNAFRDDARLRMTLEALQQLAHYFAGVEGKKNVVWFSGAFPMVLPNMEPKAESTMPHDYGELIQETDAALVAAQVAIYPVAAEDLADSSLHDVDTMLPVHSAYEAQQETNKSLQTDASARNAAHATMDQIARDTGGEATYNSNGLKDALARVMDRGSFYYTLYYTPSKLEDDRKFRSIKVKVANKSYKLAYRRGYYAKKVDVAKIKPGVDPLRAQMGLGLPDSTQIPIALRVQAVGVGRYAVDFVIAAKGLRLDAAADGGRHGKVEAALVVYDRDGKALSFASRQVDLTMDAARWAQVEANGVNFRLEVDAAKGADALRGGVYDLESGASGTVEVGMDRIVAMQGAAIWKLQ